jgi:hypothetical protein
VKTTRLTSLSILAIGLLAALHRGSPAIAEGKGQHELAVALAGAKVTLSQGLAAGAATGTPISAKFELEDGKLQLSVYTQTDDSFSEVVVDHTTGKVTKSEPITSADDLKEAKAQSAAMAAAKRTLRAATDKALHANPGYRAVSVVPTVKAGRASAEVTLVKGEAWKTLAEPIG